MILFSQRDPRWSGHVLGWGPALGTIGQYGCLDTVFAMIATDSGHQQNPAEMDQDFTNAGIFMRDSTGTFDLLPDNALVRAFPNDYALVQDVSGYRGDLIAMAVPSPDIYAILWIATASVPTHFVLAYSADGRYIADPWTGQVGTLAGYGGPGAVHKTFLVQHLPHVVPAPVPAPLPAPTPVPIPTPPPMDFYSFHPVIWKPEQPTEAERGLVPVEGIGEWIPAPNADLHPADQVTTLSDAEAQADNWALANSEIHLQVRLSSGELIYTAFEHGTGPGGSAIGLQ